MPSLVPRVALVLWLSACGGSGAATGATSSGDDAPAADRCEGYAVTDACMNEDNFAACLQRAAECPGEVAVLESCPLQFGCP